MQRSLAALCLLFSWAAFAYENPRITPSIVTLEVGETKTLALTTWWSGLTAMPQHNVFVSDAPDVAQVTGSLTWVGSFDTAPVLEPIQVKALAPGVAHIIDLGLNRRYATVFVQCDPPGSGIAFPLQERVNAEPWQEVQLEIWTAGFENPSYAWYAGEIGDFTVATGGSSATTTVFSGSTPTVFHTWAEVWDGRCNYAALGFTVAVASPWPRLRRAARH